MYQIIKNGSDILGKTKLIFKSKIDGGQYVLKLRFHFNIKSSEIETQGILKYISGDQSVQEYWQLPNTPLEKEARFTTPNYTKEMPKIEFYLWLHNNALWLTIDQPAQSLEDPFLEFTLLEEEIVSNFHFFILRKRADKIKKKRRR